MALLIMAICAVLFWKLLKALYRFKVKRAHEARNNQFIFQNVQNEILEIFKMFKNNKLINSKISNWENNTTLMMFLCCY